MRSVLVAAVSGLLLTASAAWAQPPRPAAQAGGPPRPSYNYQSAGEDIGPFAGGAKVRRQSTGQATPHGKARRHR